MPAITRMVGIGVSFSAVRTVSIMYLLLFALSQASECLCIDRTQHIEVPSAIIA